MQDNTQPIPPIRTLCPSTRPISLVEAIRNVYGPGYLPHLSRVRLVEGSSALRQISDSPAPPQSGACEAENDPFDENFDVESDGDEDDYDDGSDIIGKRQQPALSSFSRSSHRPGLSAELETQNGHLMNDFGREGEEDEEDEEDEEKAEEVEEVEEAEEEAEEENWEGFQDTISTRNFDVLPPPIASFESGDLALQSVQKWAQEHGYALRTRSSKRRSPIDEYLYKIYLECDRGGRNKGLSKINGKQLRKSSTRRRECLFRCLIGQPKKDTHAL